MAQVKHHQKPLLDRADREVNSRPETLQDAIAARVQVLKDGQSARAEVIQQALERFENNGIRIRSVSDYEKLVKAQRLLLGLDNGEGTGVGKLTLEFVEANTHPGNGGGGKADPKPEIKPVRTGRK